MLKTIQGIYRDGQIELNEIPDNIPSQTQVIVTFITQSNSEELNNQITTYHDLDFLSGTWSQEDEIEFLSHTNEFNQIDEKLWQ
ncbi:hypothetical protein [Argonema galeatum]|uniref:hypothetical protein n=1 Tax=Argonema galeatum TaxID=2942762 RepID=UPI0020129517|nr:hypothetical protein [Argonema galeatum]MCL1465508.1 hypothetical protein [Argonema galeatum A003/A1]